MEKNKYRYIHGQLSHFAVYLKPTQYGKSTTLRFTKINKSKKPLLSAGDWCGSTCAAQLLPSRLTLCDPKTVARQAPRPWDSPGKNTGVHCRSLLQGTFPNQGLNPWVLCLLHGWWVLHCWASGEAPKTKHRLRESKVKVKSLSPVRLFATPWTVPYQAPPSMGFSRQEYRSELPVPSPGIFPTQGSNPDLLHCRQTLYPLSHQGSHKTRRIYLQITYLIKDFYPEHVKGILKVQKENFINGQKICIDTASQRVLQMTNEHVKWYPVSVVTREMQI